MSTTRFSSTRLVALLAVLSAGVALAERPADRLSAGRPGAIVDAPSGVGEVELLSFDATFTARLLALAPEEGLRADDWPIAPGKRRSVQLTRRDVYSPDAKIVVVENGMAREAPRSRLAFYQGVVTDASEAGTILAAWVDPETAEFGAVVTTREGTMLLAPPDASSGGRARLALESAFQKGGVRPTWECGNSDEFSEVLHAPAGSNVDYVAGRVPLVGTLTHTAVIAFDTDSEYLSLRFSNNTVNATNYIAQLVLGTSTIYERDVAASQGNGVRILQGYTIIRVGSDPYSNTLGSADQTKLDEFANYWEANYPRSVVHRAATALLSGRQGGSCSPSGCSASGIARIQGLCNGNGYNVDELFNTSAFGISFDLLILAHEIGHNFGAFHTHNCAYGNTVASPPIDLCLAAEGGCLPQGSCPVSQIYNGVTATGTLMSYCHLRSPNDCTTSLVFHPRSVSQTPSNGFSSILTNVGCLPTLSGGVVPAAPTITNLTVTSGPVIGGTITSITGTNFLNGATVAFANLTNGVGATSVTFLSSTNVIATTPAHAAGSVDVVVMNPGFQTATLRNGFNYTSAGTPPPPPPVSAATTFNALAPCRVLDTRNPAAPLGGPSIVAFGLRSFVATGVCGVPAGTVAISANATVVTPTASGDLVLYPNGIAVTPTASSLSFRAGATRANNSLVYLASDGSFLVKNNAAGMLDFIVDVNGYFK